ncbi:MAG: FAD-dependent oxidoreductase [Deltaproteobacteria bacterium]|nr:FAD-dependent oxidoreductase [Candidatus Anaeroferrophillus wilburensis]MBN2887974.1 FAD-dependent oxidoreductase [Deltaproteobacteria bacterium]
MGKQLVLAGGGHAHMVTLANLGQFVAKGHQVTVIQPSVYHYYSGMGPGLLGRTYRPEDIRFATRQLVEKNGGRFILDKVARIDAERKKVVLVSGGEVAYDVLSCNTGSYVSTAIVRGEVADLFTVKPIDQLLKAQKRIVQLVARQKITITIIGGGPAATEIAGNVWRLAQDNGGYAPHIRVCAGREFLGRFPAGVRRKAFDSLSSRGIEILEGERVQAVAAGRVVFASGQELATDLVFLALGVVPSPIFMDSGLPTGPDGGLLVNEDLQCKAHPEIFGGGDCIFYEKQPLDKVGVYAVRQNPVLFHNLMASLDGGSLQSFSPGGDYLLIFNMGDDTGVLHKWGMTFAGRLAFTIKDAIDRKFMRRFQALETK